VLAGRRRPLGPRPGLGAAPGAWGRVGAREGAAGRGGRLRHGRSTHPTLRLLQRPLLGPPSHSNPLPAPRPRAPPQGDTIRSGQTVAFVEQLGTFVEIKSQQGGEVIKFKAAEGDPVEYGQTVLELAPTFSLVSPAT
jgi:hypothetical protein